MTKENKPGEVRRVANESSVFQGQSLNSNLLKGPDFLSNLTVVILRFRENKIALSADIEQMFMQVKVAPEDRKFLSFLWNNDGRIETYEYTSHILEPQTHHVLPHMLCEKLLVTTKNSFQKLSNM